MHARAPVFATRAQIASGQSLVIKVKRGGTGRQGGNGPTGYKATPRALLARALRERDGVAKAEKTRQEANVAAKKRPLKLYGAL